jgi:hypothetical protein
MRLIDLAHPAYSGAVDALVCPLCETTTTVPADFEMHLTGHWPEPDVAWWYLPADTYERQASRYRWPDLIDGPDPRAHRDPHCAAGRHSRCRGWRDGCQCPHHRPDRLGRNADVFLRVVDATRRLTVCAAARMEVHAGVLPGDPGEYPQETALDRAYQAAIAAGRWPTAEALIREAPWYARSTKIAVLVADVITADDYRTLIAPWAAAMCSPDRCTRGCGCDVGVLVREAT